MSILIERASSEVRAKFFHKNRFALARLLDDLAEPAKKPKRKKKSETKAKVKAKPKAKAKAKAKEKPKAKAKEKAKPKAKPKETPKIEEKKPSTEELVVDTIAEVVVQEVPSTDAPAPTDTPNDLTEINGLGTKMVGSLNSVGITTFEQLANLTKKEIAKLGKSIRGFAAAYERKDFKKQAQELNK
jgi:predicted flap endonuclease-1-like 5' DNA nuclease